MALRNELLLTLMKRVDVSSDASALRDVMAVWLALLGKFSPLIGPASVHLLFMRGLDINRPVFPWLPAFAPGSAGDHYFSAFEASINMQPSAEVIRATRALLGTYIDSLFTLIGPTLTAKFVGAAVGDQRPKK
ncbi:MAG: hypothetical protein V4693_11970 [Pseudomonadota bacterium]